MRTFNSSRPRRNRRYFADDLFKCIFLNKNVWILNKLSLKFILKGPVNDIAALVRIMAGHYLNTWLLFYWRVYASLVLNELTFLVLSRHILAELGHYVHCSLWTEQKNELFCMLRLSIANASYWSYINYSGVAYHEFYPRGKTNISYF